MQLSKNLSYSEAVTSYTAIKFNIDNTPPAHYLLNMFILANNLFQPIRDHFDVPIYVSSFYRSPQLNKQVGGSERSDHLTGNAIDLDADVFGVITNAQIFHYVKDNLPFKKLIWELGDDQNPDWVHISFSPELNGQKTILQAYREGQTIKYKPWT